MSALDFNDADGSGPGTAPSKWSKDCTTGCVTGTKADGTTGNTGWTSIGYFDFDDNGTPDDTSDDIMVDNSFSGRFHGNELSISNLYINRQSDGIIFGGLFGSTSSSTLDSLGLENIEIEIESTGVRSYAGGLVGASSSGIIACYATGSVSSTSTGTTAYISSDAGGLVGISSSSITASYATGDVSSTSTGTNYSFYSDAGGLVGSSWSSSSSSSSSSIIFCYATGDVSSTSTSSGNGSGSDAGGLTGRSDGDSITACYATGDVSSKSSNSGSGSGVSSDAGGLVGTMGDRSSSITACYATGDVSSTSSGSSGAGGLVGDSISYSGRSSITSITACYATGDVSSVSNGTSAHSYAGGLLGRMGDSTITACYATGNVSSTSSGNVVSANPVYASNAGGLVGSMFSSNTIDSYYRSEATITATQNGVAGTINTEGAQTSTALQTPTSGAGIYASWIELELDDGATEGIDDRTQAGDPDYDLVWDFGTNMQYPALKIDFDGEDVMPRATVAEFGPQRMPLFGRDTYELTVRVDATEGTVVGTAEASIAHGADALTYSITSQKIDDDTPTTSGFAFAIDPTSALTVAIGATLILGQVYTLMVQVSGNRNTDEVEVRIEVVPPLPVAPTGLIATAISAAQINLSWTAPNDDGGSAITGYKLQWHKDGATAFGQEITGIAADASSHTHTGLEQGTTYHYRLIAINVLGDSEPSNEASTTTQSTPNEDGDMSTFNVPKAEASPNLYPNPTSGEVRFLGLSVARSYVYKVYSLVGQEVLSGVLGSEEVNISALSSGQYVLVLEDDQGEVLRTRLLVK